MIAVSLPNGVRSVTDKEALFLTAQPNGAALAPALDAGRRGLVDIAILPLPRAPWPIRYLRESRRPTIVLICDDPGNPGGAGGPSAWRCAATAARWCAAAIIHGAAGEAPHYAEAVRGAIEFHRLLLVETVSGSVKSWNDTIRCATTLLILPNRGAHPVDDRVLH